MPKNRSRKRGNRRANRENRGQGENLGRNGFGFADPSTYHTISVVITPGTSTVAVAPGWDDFGGYVELSDFYEYFVPTSYKIDVQVPKGDTVGSGIVAFVPINYITGPTPASLTISSQDLLTIRGRVEVMEGARNNGRWCVWPHAQQNMALESAATQEAGFVVATGIGTQTTILVSITCRFYRRYPFAGLTNGGQVIPVRSLKDIQKDEGHSDMDIVIGTTKQIV